MTVYDCINFKLKRCAGKHRNGEFEILKEDLDIFGFPLCQLKEFAVVL